MKEDRRSEHASSLRHFFNEQVQHLHDLLSGQQPEVPAILDADQQVIEHVVDLANTRLRAVYGYTEKLRSHVSALYQHVLATAEQIPPPVELSHATFGSDALVNALFVAAADIDHLLPIGSEADVYWAQNRQLEQLYALLTAHKSEKSVLGVGMLGNMLVRDMPRQAVNFSAPQLHMPCANSDELAKALRNYLLDQVVGFLKQDMTAQTLAQAMEPGDHSYQGRINSLANPDKYLDALLNLMQVPGKLLAVDNYHFRLNKQGIKLDEGDDSLSANEFDIPEISWSNGSKNVLLQVVYQR
jgi:hypothetical protein